MRKLVESHLPLDLPFRYTSTFLKCSTGKERSQATSGSLQTLDLAVTCFPKLKSYDPVILMSDPLACVVNLVTWPLTEEDTTFKEPKSRLPYMCCGHISGK